MNFFDELANYDAEVADACSAELARQQRNIELIASENIVSKAVLLAAGTVLTNKYAEGFPGKRYYGGCQCVDVVEDIARERDVQNRSTAVTRAITELDNVEIEVVPSDHMLTAYDFTEGAVRGVSAKQIEMWLVHPSCIITPINYEFSKLDPPAAGSDGKYVYYEESEEDCFLLPNKEAGCEFFVSGMVLGTASFTTAAYSGTGAVAGDATLTLTAPSGANLLAGSRYFYKVQASTAPDAPVYGESLLHTAWIEWDGTSTINVTNGQKMTLVVTDSEGRAYASGTGTVTSKT